MMVLSGSQQLLLAVSLALCACFLLPRMFGGGVRDTGKQDPRRVPPPKGSQGNPHTENTKNLNQIKSQMDKQIKTEMTGTGHSMAFTLMPIYAIGVAVFAAYKFSKSNEKNKSKPTKEEKKAKETENQLLELDTHLSHTEKMLNSLLTQLEPLSHCVNSLAAEKKDEIMNQLQSIRLLMKKSGMEESAFSNSGNESCKDTLEDLIDLFNDQRPGISEMDEEKEDAGSKLDVDNHDLCASEDPEVSDCKEEDSSQMDEQDVTPRHSSEGLRKRNIKD
ncbi:uncharacterized protein LOC120980759 [Bufo bufo]|uniref:uncharacterized protein LOC120980759 n=1 Tax=Bufo bufo TaxID=8384 RepID=UPI001ABE363B|nr:uncharacterized protein LOC120980759 [Bufo bufo]